MALPSPKPHTLLGRLPHLNIESFEMGPILLSGSEILAHPTIPKENHGSLLLDTQALLYFSAAIQPIISDQEPPPIHTFYTSGEEGAGKKVLIDEGLTHAFGNLLTHLYLEDLRTREKEVLCQSIHLFNMQFHPIMMGQSVATPTTDLIHSFFLPQAFSLLEDLPVETSRTKMKQLLRARLALKFGRPVEVLWKWLDAFYSYHKSKPRMEPKSEIYDVNISLSYPLDRLAQKLFIYNVCCHLQDYGMLRQKKSYPPTPLSFDCCDVREILIYLWSEERLLQKLSILLMQKEKNLELEADIVQLTELYTLFVERFVKENDRDATYLPLPKNQMSELVQAVKAYGKELPKDFLELCLGRLT